MGDTTTYYTCRLYGYLGEIANRNIVCHISCHTGTFSTAYPLERELGLCCI